MVKISVSKIIGEEQILPQHAASRKIPLWQTWQSRISRFPRKILWPLLASILLLQGLACWRIFFYSPPIPPSPPYDVAETVGLVTKWYELLRDMHYLGPDAIAYAPHTGEREINVTLAVKLGLDQRVIETMQRLPYIEDRSGGWMQLDKDILWRDGHFVDYRNDYDVWATRDPLIRWRYSFAKEVAFEDAMLEFEALPRSAIPLSIIRPQGYNRYGLVIVLDTASNRIVVLDTQGGGGWNSDPFFSSFAWDTMPREYKINGVFYGQENMHGRLAQDFLSDIILRTAVLESGFVPGSVRQDNHYTPELCPPKWEGWVRTLFRESGWPFDRAKFEDYLFPNPNTTVNVEPLKPYQQSTGTFETKMRELQHNISIKYMPNRYCPVPRDPGFISKLVSMGKLTDEQIAYAQSDEEIIPLNLESWGANLVFVGR